MQDPLKIHGLRQASLQPHNGSVFRLHISLQPPQFSHYYYFNTTLALFLKSAALEQFFLTSGGCRQLCLKTRITKSSKE